MHTKLPDPAAQQTARHKAVIRKLQEMSVAHVL